ncbi:MAG TPA: energy transducer TonB [Chitinophagaceae bacterium]|nr:energy transducer TonB [Chitinophagaceae bacterium]
MFRILFVVLLLFACDRIIAQDTLLFRLSNPWNTVKDPAGQFLRKAVLTDSGWLTLDYNSRNILVARSYYTDTNFRTKLHCHKYFHEQEGYFEEVRCYQNGQLNGTRAGFNKKGDTLWRETLSANTIIERKHFPGYESEDRVFIKLEMGTNFPGGDAGWARYLSENLRYPKEAVRKKIEGAVTISFIVSKEGKITDVTVVKSAHPLLDKEALRLIQNSPNWTPAEQGGRPVKAYKRQTITFKL